MGWVRQSLNLKVLERFMTSESIEQLQKAYNENIKRISPRNRFFGFKKAVTLEESKMLLAYLTDESASTKDLVKRFNFEGKDYNFRDKIAHIVLSTLYYMYTKEKYVGQ